MRLFILLSLLPWAPGCTTLTQSDLAKRDEYALTMSSLAAGELDQARLAFPKKEAGGFITSLEKGWLAVLDGKPDTEPLLPIGRNLESRKTLSARKEAKSFFYKEAEDGYYPAEHEAIALHLVTGFAFAEQGKWPEAKVEARKAAFYLQNDFGSEPGFDDPALRMWLAALWAATGEWQSARVDFRAMAGMGKEYAWAKTFADAEAPPAELAVVFAGPGPDVGWNPHDGNDLDHIVFIPGTDVPKLETAAGAAPHFASAAAWYARHQERDRAIRDVLKTSRYMAEGVLPATAAGVTATAGVAAGTTIVAGGIALGAGVAVGGIYVAVTYLTGDLAGYVALFSLAGGYLIIDKSVDVAGDVIDKSSDAAGDMLDEGFNPTNSYRYVRFLPDHVGIASADVKGRQPFATLKGGATAVKAYFVPGTGRLLNVLALDASYRENDREWVLLPRKTSRDDAEAACGKLPEARKLRFRLPTWYETIDGRAGGLFEPRRNTFAAGLQGEFWLAEEGNAPRTSCHYLETKDMGQTPTKDCAATRGVLCIRAPKKR